MKKIILMLLVALNANAQDVLKIDPLLKLGVCTSRNLGITDINTGGVIRLTAPYMSRYQMSKAPMLRLSLTPKFDYYTTVGFRASFKGFRVESENKIRIATDDFINNKPYAAEFYVRAYYEVKNVKIGAEHLCLHPIRTGDIGQVFQLRGGHTEFFISLNL